MSQHNDVTFFKEILKEARFYLSEDENCHFMEQEQILVIRDIGNALKSHIAYPNNSHNFVIGLERLCELKDDFQKALSYSELKKNTTDSNWGPKINQDCLIRLLLSVECLQEEVTLLLLNEISKCVVDELEDSAYLKLLLNPLRNLSFIKDPKHLSQKLLDIVEIAPLAKKGEILTLLPEIVPDSEHEEIAKQFVNLLQEDELTIGAIIECLNLLHLSYDTREEIQQQILNLLEGFSITSSSSTIFPLLVQFLLAHCDKKNISRVLGVLRNSIDSNLAVENSNAEIESIKASICTCLHMQAMTRKYLCEAWINLIESVHHQSNTKTVDYLILLDIHSLGHRFKLPVENLFRKKIKCALFRIVQFETLFQKYFVIQNFKDYLTSTIEIATNLIRQDNNPLLIEFGSTTFTMLFNHSLITSTQQQEIINSLMLLIRPSGKKNFRPVLNDILIPLSETNFSTLQHHITHLMGILKKLDLTELKDVKSIFSLLCNLTCSEKVGDSMSAWKDEIHTIIRKQLSTSKKVAKHKGIVAAIVMSQILITVTTEQMQTENDDSITIDDLPEGPILEAANLITLANTCTLGSPDSVGLYYDQLAAMVVESPPNLDNRFMLWLYQSMTNEFQNIFVSETSPPVMNDFKLTTQMSLNSNEEMEEPISIKIGELTSISQYYESSSILILAPMFRFVRLIHFRQHEGDLSSIDALLGCPVIMPSLENLDEYETHNLKRVADCIFHCINWFREIISAFVTQKSKSLKLKVLKRLAGIVELEKLLEKCLKNIPEHKLPSSYFDSLSETSKKPPTLKPVKTKKSTKRQKVSDTTINPDESIQSTSAAPSQQLRKSSMAKKYAPELNTTITFREIDTDCLLLLKYQLKLSENETVFNSPLSQITQSQTNLCLNLQQVIFLVNDMALKLSSINHSNTLYLSHSTKIISVDLVTDCIRLLPSINRHLNTITMAINDILEKCDGCLDSEALFTSEANDLKKALNSILKCYALILNWNGFQQAKHSNLLKEYLKALRKKEERESTSLKGSIEDFVTTLSGYIKYCIYLPAAVNVVKMLQSLNTHYPYPEMQKKIKVISGKLLTNPWYNLNAELEMGKQASSCIDILVKSYLKDMTIKNVCGMVATLQKQAEDLKSKEDSLRMLSSINKSNFYLLYRSICVALLNEVRKGIVAATNTQHLELWRTTALTMQGLMTIATQQGSKTNLNSFLKNSVAILKIFINNGIPILEIMLQTKTEQVIEIFKIIQTSTRYLHSLCCQSKISKDTSLMAYVPQFRLVLETLVYKVKAALIANNCSAAFWMGNLKNKNLYGEEIESQEMEEVDDDNDEAKSDNMSDDNEEDISISNDTKDTSDDGDSSASDIF